MSKFKVGDVVQRSRLTDTGNDCTVGLSYKRGDTGIVEEVRGDLVRIAGWYHLAETLMLAEDELPPAPESGLYFSHRGCLSVSLKLGEGVIALGTSASKVTVRLTPETALVLASDLRRMAMSIKRKEKQG